MTPQAKRLRIQQILYNLLDTFNMFQDLWIGVGMDETHTTVTVYCGPNLLIERTLLSDGMEPHSIVAALVDLDGDRLIRQVEDWMHGSRARVHDETDQVSWNPLTGSR